jgi:hypothetical protein
MTVELSPTTTRAPAPKRAAEPDRADAAIHWLFLAMAASVLALSFMLEAPGGELVIIPGLNLPLPGVCTFKRLLGIGCPGCGLTRCFISIAHGDLAAAWAYNPMGILLFAATVFQVPFRWLQLRRIRRGSPTVRWSVLNWFLWFVMLALIVQWVGRTVFLGWV